MRAKRKRERIRELERHIAAGAGLVAAGLLPDSERSDESRDMALEWLYESGRLVGGVDAAVDLMLRYVNERKW